MTPRPKPGCRPKPAVFRPSGSGRGLPLPATTPFELPVWPASTLLDVVPFGEEEVGVGDEGLEAGGLALPSPPVTEGSEAYSAEYIVYRPVPVRIPKPITRHVVHSGFGRVGSLPGIIPTAFVASSLTLFQASAERSC